MSVLAGVGPVLLLMGPVLVLAVIGLWTIRDRPGHWRTVGGALVIGTIVWAAFVAPYEHETNCHGDRRCPNVYGLAAPLAEPNGIGFLVLFGSFVGAAAVLGATTRTPSVAIGASLVALPSALAWWTAPRGDNDGLWVLIFWVLAFIGAFAAGCAETARSIAVNVRRRRPPAGRGPAACRSGCRGAPPR